MVFPMNFLLLFGICMLVSAIGLPKRKTDTLRFAET